MRILKTIETIIILFLLQSCGAYADVNQCGQALDDCIALNTEQSNYIIMLKREVKDLEGQAKEESHPVVWALVGVVLGGVGALILNRQGK